MRLSVNLDDSNYRAAKALAKAEDCSLSKAVNRLIAQGFAHPAPHDRSAATRPGRMPPFPTSPSTRRFGSAEVDAIEASALDGR